MKLTFGRKEFQARLADVCAVADRKAAMQALTSHFLLDAKANISTLTATDLETTLRELMADALGVEEEGSLCLPAQKLFEIVRMSENCEIRIESLGERVHVLTGQSKYRLPALPASDFPEFPKVKDAHKLDIHAGSLLKLLERTIYAAAQENLERYTLQGILLHLKTKKRLTLAGCDGHNLAAASTLLSAVGGEDIKDRKYILPGKSAKELQKILSGLDAEANLTVHLGENLALFQSAELEFAARLLEGAYPDYNKIIPKKNETIVRVANEAFQRALERMALADKVISLKFKGERIYLSAQSPEAGEAEETFQPEEHTGANVKVCILAAPFLRALKAIGDASVTIGLTDDQSPILLHSAEEGEAANYKCVVMPRRKE
ncbi:MAG: DNA polymerase III subunit beta [Nitrospiraceae bacterium]|nr:DNA polymerase III subunit beta [Nitrospiraceae bacterium]